jgi:hypothetical protein
MGIEAVDRVMSQQVRQVVQVGEVVDPDHVESLVCDELLEGASAYPTEAVDCYTTHESSSVRGRSGATYPEMHDPSQECVLAGARWGNPETSELTGVWRPGASFPSRVVFC